MLALIMLFLATIMAIFGILGYQRGTRSSIVTAALIWLCLGVLQSLGGRVATIVNGLYFGVRFVLAGGLQALGSNENRSEAIEQIFQSMEQDQDLMSADGTGIGLLLVFGVLVGVGLLLGGLRWFKGKASAFGLIVGLVNGYVTSAFLLGRLAPEASGFLPLPFGLSGPPGQATQAVAAVPAPGFPTGVGLGERLTAFLATSAKSEMLPIVVALLIAFFVLLATRFGSRGARKG